jgi:hypothetical protein
MKRIETDYHRFSGTAHLFIRLSVCLFIQLSCILHSASGQSTTALPYPWSGGLNSCQFCSIDINVDGTTDLLVFDRHGNRILPYIRTTWGLQPAPEYAGLFPDLHDWVTTADYNCDGKMDLFTYGLGGARVFENVSDTVLKFHLVTDMLKSYYYTGFIGILLTPVDYPAVADIDGDGDLDLLTFFGLGSFVEYHRNHSMEHFGNCDSLDYKLADHCWGNFKESEGSNRITLGVACPYKFSNTLTCAGSGDGDPPKHTGSTLLATDLNGDGLKDLLLGDVDFPELIALTNGGTPDSANMISQDTLFPSGDVPVRLFSFPAGSMPDIDGDGVYDLLVSPFDPNLIISENRKSIWYYRNYGTNVQPDFRFVTDRLFLQDMLDFGSAASPVLYDLNGDGLTDFVAGCYGTYDSSWYAEGVLHSGFTSGISYFKNTGAGFEFITADLGSVSSLSIRGACPAFGDLNGDGFPDMVTGNADGTLVLFANSGTGADPPVFLPPVMKYLNIDVGEFSAPQLFDLDKDGLSDLILGTKAGKISYYRNTGTSSSPSFTHITDSLGRINVTDTASSVFGYSTPCFFRTQDQETRLLVGSESGRTFYFRDIDGNLGGAFTRSDSLFETVGIPSEMPAVGWRTAPAIGHVNDPALMDIILGNYSGGLNYFTSFSQPHVIPGITETPVIPSVRLSVYPNPAGNQVTISTSGNNPSGDMLIEIIDPTGRSILKQTFRNQITVQTHSLNNGFYIIKVSSSTLGHLCKGLVIVH